MRKLNPFKPSDYTGCQLWLDGADPNGTGRRPASGTVLTSWTDKSGSGNTVTLPSLTYSVNTFTGYPGVVFTSGTASSQLTLSPYDCFFASSYTSSLFPISYPGLLGQTAVVIFGNYWQSANFMANGGGFNTNGLNTYGNYVADARNMTVSDVYSLPSSTFALRVGSGDQYPNNSWLGHIYEVIVFSNALNTRQRQQVEGYLCQKWGTVSYLPAGHPGRTGVIYPRNLLIDTLITGQPTRLPFIRSRATLQTRTFTYTGTNQTFTLPASISPATITVYMWGAAGGGEITPAGTGGAGAMVQGILAVSPGQTLTILVGGGGQSTGAGGFGGGGNAANQYAGGGGRSSITISGTEIVIAGAGGGGVQTVGGGIGTFSGNGGDGSGWDGTASMGGKGGNANGTGGAGGIGSAYNGVAGNGRLGGVGTDFSSGGGAGYGGGGSSGVTNTVGASGGGGSSLTSNLTLIPGQSVLGYNSTNGFSAPNSSSPYYQAGVAAGVSAGNGGNGLVVILYNA